jgi:hypothetical protein
MTSTDIKETLMNTKISDVIATATSKFGLALYAFDVRFGISERRSIRIAKDDAEFEAILRARYPQPTH